MLLVTNTCLALTSVALAVSTQIGVATVPVLYVLTAIGSAFGALDQPARSALAPSLVERRLIPAAMALNQSQFQVAQVVGPAIAGVLIARFGLAPAYWIDVATFTAATGTLLLMRVPRTEVRIVHAAPLRALADGMAFLWSRPLLLATMSVDFFATFFAVSRAVMPYYADRVFAVGPEGLGLLYAAPGAGATVVALTSGWTNRAQRRGLGILVSVAIFGLAIALFGLLPPTGFIAGLALLAIAQGADTVSSIFRHTILQLETPDALRGRLSAINLVFVAGGPQLGQVESGVVADLWSPEASVISGGLACVGMVFVAHALAPEVARYRAEVLTT
jgi:MFS family permease